MPSLAKAEPVLNGRQRVKNSVGVETSRNHALAILDKEKSQSTEQDRLCNNLVCPTDD